MIKIIWLSFLFVDKWLKPCIILLPRTQQVDKLWQGCTFFNPNDRRIVTGTQTFVPDNLMQLRLYKLFPASRLVLKWQISGLFSAKCCDPGHFIGVYIQNIRSGINCRAAPFSATHRNRAASLCPLCRGKYPFWPGDKLFAWSAESLTKVLRRLL